MLASTAAFAENAAPPARPSTASSTKVAAAVSPALGGASAPARAGARSDSSPEEEKSRKSRASRSGERNSRQEQRERAIEEIRQAIRVFRRETERYGVAGSGKRPISKASSSAWHGRIYEYLRNDSLDAVPHEVKQRGGNANVLRRNQFGFSVSGPVVLPKLYNGRGATFFTFSYEGTRERLGRSYLRTLPTSGQRAGEFSDLVDKAGNRVTLYDPASTRRNPAFDAERKVSPGNLDYERDPFPNNRIPATRFDRVSRTVLPHYPQPNTDVGPFLRNNYWANPSERGTPAGFLAKIDHNLFARHKLSVDLAYSKGFQGLPRIYDTIANPGSPDRRFRNRRLKLSDVFAVSPNTIYTARFEVESDSIETDGLRGARDIPEELGLPGVSGKVFPALRFQGVFGMGASGGSYRRNAWNSYGIAQSLELRRGRHSWRISSNLRRYQLNTNELDLPSGEFRFNDDLTGLPGITNTGASFASFLLGLSNRAEISDQIQPSYLRRLSFQNGVRDEFQIKPNFTATFGVNVDLTTPRVEKYDRQATIDLTAVNPANGLPGALIFAGRDGAGRAFQPVRVRLEPNVGFSWNPGSSRDTVIRASFWRYYGAVGLRPGPFGTQGFSARRNPLSPNEQLAPAVVLQDGPPPLEHPLPDLRPEAANDTDVDLIPQTSAQPTYNYLRIALERRLPMGFIVRAAGRAYRGRNMLIGGQIAGLNRVPVAALGYRDRLNDETFRRSLRPFPQLQRIKAAGQYPAGRYRYNIGDLSVEKRAGQGLSLDFSYRYLDRRDDYSGPGIQDPADRQFAWARTRNLRPHRVSLNYNYELPFGRGHAFLNSAGWMSKLLGDWSVSGFTTWLSGDPIVLEPLFNNTGGVVPDLRVNSVPGVDPRVDDPGPGFWFNPRAFVDPDDFALGDVPRTHPTLRNPGFNNHDLALTKRLKLTREKSLEFLFQSFNFINHANWNDPDAEIGPAGARNLNAGRIIGSRGGRVLQLGLRYNF